MTLEEKIIDFISKYHRGHENAVPSDEIARTIDRVGYPTSPEEVQKIVGEIRRAKKALIGSSTDGFFLIETEEDNAITQSYLRGRVGPILKAAEALEQMWTDKNGGKVQGVLSL
jgi:hypothetical protein